MAAKNMNILAVFFLVPTVQLSSIYLACNLSYSLIASIVLKWSHWCRKRLTWGSFQYRRRETFCTKSQLKTLALLVIQLDADLCQVMVFSSTKQKIIRKQFWTFFNLKDPPPSLLCTAQYITIALFHCIQFQCKVLYL